MVSQYLYSFLYHCNFQFAFNSIVTDFTVIDSGDIVAGIHFYCHYYAYCVLSTFLPFISRKLDGGQLYITLSFPN